MTGTINKVILIGHVGDAVKMNYFDGGDSIARFPIATHESYTNKQSGEKVITTEWHNIAAKNKLAEICEKHLSKGDKIYCEGRIKTRQWEQDGRKRYTTEIRVTNITFLSTKNVTVAPVSPNTVNQSQATEPPKSDIADIADEEDDLSF